MVFFFLTWILFAFCFFSCLLTIISMMVSNLNSLATVCWEDFVSQMPQFKGLSDKQQLFILKIITVICGFITMGVAFGVGLLSGVIESSLLAFSATSGPLLGCFILAMLVPVANWKVINLSFRIKFLRRAAHNANTVCVVPIDFICV